MIFMTIKILILLVNSFSFMLLGYYLGRKKSLRLCNQYISNTIEETEKFKNTCNDYIGDAVKEIETLRNTIEKQQHLIEMLKMKLRDK